MAISNHKWYFSIVSKVFGLFGAGGFGREIVDFALNTFDKKEIKFIDDNFERQVVNGYEVLSRDSFLNINVKDKYFNISVSNSLKRKEIADYFINQNCKIYDLISPTSILQNYSKVGLGSVRCDFTLIAPNANIGKFFHANRYTQVSHDCIIGDYVTFAPSVGIMGNVKINDHVYIGLGALIKNGTSERPIIIGENAVVGMGAVVLNDVEPNTTVVGNPARTIET